MKITYSCLNLISDCELVIKLPAVAGLICTPHAVIPATAKAKKLGDYSKTTWKDFENKLKLKQAPMKQKQASWILNQCKT